MHKGVPCRKKQKPSPSVRARPNTRRLADGQSSSSEAVGAELELQGSPHRVTGSPWGDGSPCGRPRLGRRQRGLRKSPAPQPSASSTPGPWRVSGGQLPETKTGLGRFVLVQPKPSQPLGSSFGTRALPFNGLYLKMVFCTAREASLTARQTRHLHGPPRGPLRKGQTPGTPAGLGPSPPPAWQRGASGNLGGRAR